MLTVKARIDIKESTHVGLLFYEVRDAFEGLISERLLFSGSPKGCQLFKEALDVRGLKATKEALKMTSLFDTHEVDRILTELLQDSPAPENPTPLQVVLL